MYSRNRRIDRLDKIEIMNIVILLCFVIFIIYFAICGILAYYFIKHRNIWNKTFEFAKLFDYIDYLEYFDCPIHSVFWIPNILMANKTKTDCTICQEEENDNKIYLQELQTLSSVYKLFKEIDKKCIPQNANELQNSWNMFLWLLEGSIKDYEIIKDERADVYYKLKETYATTMNQPSLNSLEKHSSDTENILSLENISYLENNIELCNKIITIFRRNRFGDNGFREIKSHYLFALMTDIDEYIRQINLLSNKIFY